MRFISQLLGAVVRGFGYSIGRSIARLFTKK